jgi:hypothetical protein
MPGIRPPARNANPAKQVHYLRALHRATRRGARLFMFEHGQHNVNGIQWEGLPADNFEHTLPAAGWRVDYLGTTTYQANFGPETVATMSQAGDMPELANRMEPLQRQLQAITPLLVNHRVHLPVWAVTATRLD